MLKKTVSILLVLVMIFLVASVASAANVTVRVDGNRVFFPDQQPFIDENGRTLVPIRFIGEEMGATVEWRADNRMVIIEYDKSQTQEKSTVDKIKDLFSLQNLMKQAQYMVNRTLIGLQVGDNKALVNGEWKTFDTKPVIVNGRTMVPLRFISETLGAEVKWDDATRTVNILTGGPVAVATQGLTPRDHTRLKSYQTRDGTGIDTILDDYIPFDKHYAGDPEGAIRRYNGAMEIYQEYFKNAEVNFISDPKLYTYCYSS
ncbi:MAG: copper amine oxidase N-terminal domain-containing protein [Candidatus Desulfaltia sp.]|nr:copper amine oxidase N-terminal domain-containing protein [Candidatus Desulfaltia sp.]